MKKIILLMLMMIALSFGVDLKGFTLGAKITPSQKANAEVYKDNTYIYITTVGGVKGQLSVYTLNDGRIFMIGFFPSDGNGEDKCIYKREVINIKNGMEKKYNIKLEYVTDDDNDYKFQYKGDEYSYVILVNKDQYEESKYDLALGITNNELYIQQDKERKQKAVNDF